MAYRVDPYVIGDEVGWYVPNRYMAHDVERMRGEYGDGPFVVTRVIDIPENPGYEVPLGYRSPRDSVGHVQHIMVAPMDADDRRIVDQVFSGTWFRKTNNDPIRFSDGSWITFEENAAAIYGE